MGLLFGYLATDMVADELTAIDQLIRSISVSRFMPSDPMTQSNNYTAHNILGSTVFVVGYVGM